MSAAASGLTADLVVPRYGDAALSDVLPSVLAALGLPGERDVLALAPLEVACVLLVDGLGWDLLRAHRTEAPFLNGLADDADREGGTGRARITAGFPTTTTTSLTSLGVGAPAGEHGMTGYQMIDPETGHVLNALQWDLQRGPHPHEWQPMATTLERAESAGVAVTTIAPAEFAGTGLTEAALRGGNYLGLAADDAYGPIVRSVLDGGGRGPALAYLYHGTLDRTGHTVGVASQQWRDELRRVDRLAAEIAAALPAGAALLVTADHGMVDIDRSQLVDVADQPALQVGVRALAGEGRCRYVHATRGADRDVLSIWRDELEDGFCVLSRAETIAAGLLGPVVTPAAAARIGDVVVLARGAGAVFDRRVDAARVRNLVGQHGSLTPAETYIPLLQYRADSWAGSRADPRVG